jgi:DNA polymerase-4
MEARLNGAGIKTVEQFWLLSPLQARQIWGSVLGERTWHRLHGHDVEDPPTKRRVIGHSKAATRLRREDYFATLFDLSVSAPDGRWWQRALKLSPGQDNFVYLKALETSGIP